MSKFKFDNANDRNIDHPLYQLKQDISNLFEMPKTNGINLKFCFTKEFKVIVFLIDETLNDRHVSYVGADYQGIDFYSDVDNIVDNGQDYYSSEELIRLIERQVELYNEYKILVKTNEEKLESISKILNHMKTLQS